MKKLLMLITGLLVFFSTAALMAEEIHLSNGDRITGVVQDLSADRVAIETRFGRLEMAKSEILKIVFHRATAGDEARLTPVTVEDLLGTIQQGSVRFYLDGKSVRGDKLANAVRLRAMMQAPTLREPREFINRFLTRSETGGRFQVRDSGKLIDLPEWLAAQCAGGLKPVEIAEEPVEVLRPRRVRGGIRDI